jgi:hypothetical protein
MHAGPRRTRQQLRLLSTRNENGGTRCHDGYAPLSASSGSASSAGQPGCKPTASHHATTAAPPAGKRQPVSSPVRRRRTHRSPRAYASCGRAWSRSPASGVATRWCSNSSPVLPHAIAVHFAAKQRHATARRHACSGCASDAARRREEGRQKRRRRDDHGAAAASRHRLQARWLLPVAAHHFYAVSQDHVDRSGRMPHDAAATTDRCARWG